jgi:hypothetical protein
MGVILGTLVCVLAVFATLEISSTPPAPDFCF